MRFFIKVRCIIFPTGVCVYIYKQVYERGRGERSIYESVVSACLHVKKAQVSACMHEQSSNVFRKSLKYHFQRHKITPH